MSSDRRHTVSWRDTFVMQAQLFEVPGGRIGEALAEVESHCTDAGQTPEEAFGDPVDYARRLAGELQSAAHRQRPWWKDALTAAATIGGIYCVLAGALAIADGTLAELTAGQVTATVVGTAVVVVVSTAVLRPGRRRIALPLAAALVVGFGLMVAVALAWDQPVLRTSGWVLAGAGLLLLVLGWWPVAFRRLENPVIDPRTGHEASPPQRLLLNVLRWGLLAVLACVVLVAVLLAALGGG